MKRAVPIKGNVNFGITLDPTIWIVDDRKIDLDVFFSEDYVEKDELEVYKEKMGKHWSREIMEGAVFPPTLESEKEFEDAEVLTGTYGIYLHHFLKNSEPKEDAKTIIFELEDGEQYAHPLAKLDDIVLKFSIDGKPIIDDGPVHILFKDGSNADDPIRNVTAIIVE